MPSDPAAAWREAVREGARALAEDAKFAWDGLRATEAPQFPMQPHSWRNLSQEGFCRFVEPALRTALATLEREGWVLVPSDLAATAGTWPMRDAATFRVGTVTAADDLWRAMLAARPTLPPPDAERVGEG